MNVFCSFGFQAAVLGVLALPGFQDAPDEMRKQRLEEMRGIAQRFKVQRVDNGSKSMELPLVESPVLRFNDPTREFHDASLWAWGEPGRPACLLAMEQYGGQWWFELISLTDATLQADAGPLKWRPTPPGVTFQPFPDAPRPAAQAPLRLAQMKDLLRELLVHEVGRTGKRYDLRLMPQPVHRYADPDAKLHDGAIFAFAYGTNPELLALVEAQGNDVPAAKWMIAFTRCGTAEPHVLLKDKEIFQLPYARQTRPTDPYWNFAHTFAKPAP